MKESSEFEYKIFEFLKSKFKNNSMKYAIQNAAKILIKNIIDVFVDCFVEDYLKEIKSNEAKMYLDSISNNCFSKDFKEKINGLINDLKPNKNENAN